MPLYQKIISFMQSLRSSSGSEQGSFDLEGSHTPRAIRERLRQGYQHSYLKDFIYGAIDGTVTTFAVVSGVAGAGLSSKIIIILGLANLLGDGFSMAASNFLGTRAEEQLRDKARKTEEKHIQEIPDGEKEEIRQIFAAKGFSGPHLEKIVKVITSNPQQWIDTMLQEELGLPLEGPSPFKAALSTFTAFVVVGALPLVSFLYQAVEPQAVLEPFTVSAVLTGLTFFIIGAFKARYVGQPWFLSGLETSAVGGCAAWLAYGVGVLLKGIL